MAPIESLSQIVENGLCIGCGLCESIAGTDTAKIVMTPEGRQRPFEYIPLTSNTLTNIQAVCPGTHIEGLPETLITPDTTIDPVWGPYLRIERGYAADPDVRFRGSTGGVLTALAIYLLESGKVDFIAHVAASKERPMRTERHLSFNRADVLAAAGSRYGPAAPLVDFIQLLERQQPFAFIGKPCDITAVRNLAQHDSRVNEYCRYLLTLVCGGASELGKSQAILDDFGLTEDELSVFRYRGYGNPGKTRIETKDGRAFELNYNDMWDDEGKWQLQFRCKICPDAIGEGADLAASDVWPGGGPTGEDSGFNGIIARTQIGLTLMESAIKEGALVIDQALTPRDMDNFQPHQVRKKKAVWARLAGLRQAGQITPQVSGLRIDSLARKNGLPNNLAEARGTLQRADEGRTREPKVEGRD
ncbi:MAG: Coenzyme F420 hydrogenase/dehydrogenase, beta subunit C-terminal domain [Chloroflexota bacterium]